MTSPFRRFRLESKPKHQGSNTEKNLQVLQYIEKSTAFDKGKGRKIETVVTVKPEVPRDDIERMCASKELPPPSLLCFTHDGKFTGFVIIGHGKNVFCHTDDLQKALLYLVIVYYITDLDYPPQFSQILCGQRAGHILRFQQISKNV